MPLGCLGHKAAKAAAGVVAADNRGDTTLHISTPKRPAAPNCGGLRTNSGQFSRHNPPHITRPTSKQADAWRVMPQPGYDSGTTAATKESNTTAQKAMPITIPAIAMPRLVAWRRPHALTPVIPMHIANTGNASTPVR